MVGNFSLSLVVPCYNEETNIQKGVLDKIGNYTRNDPRFAEILIVDDGSSDSSKKIISEKYLRVFPKFRLVENPHLGKAYAIIRGMQEAKTPYVMFSDIDLATPIEEAEKLIAEAVNGNDIVVGSRNTRREGAPFLRKVMSKGAITIKNILLGFSTVKDTQCGFKLFHRKKTLLAIDRLKVFHGKRRKLTGSSVSAGFDLELLYIASKMNYKIKEVPVAWRHVETKNVNFIRDSIEAFQDILKIKYYDFTGAYKVE